MNRRRLVLFVEGKGDRTAVPILARRVIEQTGGDDVLYADRESVTARSVGYLVRDECRAWVRLISGLGLSYRRDLAAVLLVLDGDLPQIPRTWHDYVRSHGSQEFCAWRAAAMLAEQARTARAGELFSVAIVFAMKEFEAWLLAGIESLRGVALAEGRGTVPSNAVAPSLDLEARRDAKGLLRECIPQYEPTLDQARLAAQVDLAQVRGRCKSFRRFESAIRQIAEAARAGRAILSPSGLP